MKILKLILLVLLAVAGQSKAQLTSPVSGSTLAGSSQTFTWSPGYLTGVQEYWLRVGSTPGGSNFFDRSTGTSLSQTVSGLPTDGSVVYVRMWVRVSSGWVFGDFQSYTTPVIAETSAVITAPVSRSTLGGSSETFTWDAGSGALEYWLQVGGAPGGSGIFGGTVGTSLSRTVSGLPTDRSTVYVRLWTRFTRGWVYSDYTYATSFVPQFKAEMSSPVSTLTGSSQTFTWNAGSGGLEYWLQVGSTPGGSGYFDRSAGTSLSQAVSGLPTNGNPVSVRLWTKFSSGWVYNDYTYATPVVAQTKAAMTSPLSASTLGGSSQTFTWNAGSGALEYWLQAGSSPGGNNYFSQSVGTSLNRTISGLPGNGNPVYVRLWTRFANGWGTTSTNFTDYSYNAPTLYFGGGGGSITLSLGGGMTFTNSLGGVVTSGVVGTLTTSGVLGGTLTLGAGTAITLSGGGTLITGGGETLTLGAGATLTNSGGASLFLSVAAGGTYTFVGGGNLTLGAGTTFTLAGANTLLTGTGLISVANVQSGGTVTDSGNLVTQTTP